MIQFQSLEIYVRDTYVMKLSFLKIYMYVVPIIMNEILICTQHNRIKLIVSY